jgi:hypothetical protein
MTGFVKFVSAEIITMISVTSVRLTRNIARIRDKRNACIILV